MPSNIIQWFPGHMAKTRRLITESLPDVDLVLNLLDARIPVSSRNPEIDRLVGDKPMITLMNKTALASSVINDEWRAAFSARGEKAIFIDCISGAGLNEIAPVAKSLLSEKLERFASKGAEGRRLRAMVVGIPNVGKSSMINRLAGAKKAKVENRPGVTLDRQWVTTSIGVDLLDMPGVLWPKFEDRTVGENLAVTGAIKDAVINPVDIALMLVARLRVCAPELLCARYKLADVGGQSDVELFYAVAKSRGFVVRGGGYDELRTANTLIMEFRAGTIGRITLERPTERQGL